jgi:hypothetical protein
MYVYTSRSIIVKFLPPKIQTYMYIKYIIQFFIHMYMYM